mgnify:FL=1
MDMVVVVLLDGERNNEWANPNFMGELLGACDDLAVRRSKEGGAKARDAYRRMQ